ncbi:peptide-methionine (S)-S-oxide reductase [Rufibacter roseus]|uniref:peptide-methionine (S)-S-oxide reductase n=1 Tax=Rufibacter roseus TaxID=1567108 RepID=A0ABW2DN29_9BACT|nr:peptide-methionine (S)-S-oxide reductase [Rufibacter roseus]
MTNREEENLPFIDQVAHENVETATLAMGCFWGPEAFYGAMEGVIRTRVGYAGGSTENPTYRSLADHIETAQIDYDADLVSYEQLLQQFFLRHSPTAEPYKRQYTSAIFFKSTEQETAAKKAIKQAEERLGHSIRTELIPYHIFYLAEERHQKWKLRRAPELLSELSKIYPDFHAFNNSTAVARVNGYLGGNGNLERLIKEVASFGLSYPAQQLLLNQYQTQQIDGCSMR